MFAKFLRDSADYPRKRNLPSCHDSQYSAAISLRSSTSVQAISSTWTWQKLITTIFWAYSLNVLKAFLHNIKWFFFKILMVDFSVSFGGIETIDYYIIGSPSISIFNILLQSHDVRRHPFKRYPRLGRDKNSQQRTELTKSCLFQRRRSSEILPLGLFRTQYSLARFFLDILGYLSLLPQRTESICAQH